MSTRIAYTLYSLARMIREDRYFTAGFITILVVIILSAAASIISPYDPYKIDLINKLRGPSPEHPMGTDQLGRDLFTRILYGGRYTLFLSASAILLALVIGLLVGTLSGYYKGWLDLIVQRFVDILMSFPSIILAIALATMLGYGLETLVIAVAIAESPFLIRVVRAAVISIRDLPYIEAVRLMGYGDLYVILRHVIPNIMYVVIPQVTLQMGSAILIIAALGFLGIGIKPPTPEWGSMLNEARAYLMDYPHLLIFPGLMIFLSIVSFNIVGESLKMRLDPKARSLIGSRSRLVWGLYRGGRRGLDERNTSY